MTPGRPAASAVAIVLSVLAAAMNAVSSLLERRANRDEPTSVAFHASLVGRLVRKPVWLVAIGTMIATFVLQAAALRRGPLGLVQPIMTLELPITLSLGALVMGNRLRRPDWGAVAAMTASVGALVAVSRPAGGAVGDVGATRWAIGLAAAVGLVGALTWAGWRATGGRRAALLGAAAGAGFGLTAVLIKALDDALAQGPAALFSSWATYATAVAGAGAVFLTQNALQAGRLVAAQPGLTIVDPLVATGCGIAIYGERIRAGPWIVAEVACVLVLAAATVVLSRSSATSEPRDADQFDADTDAHADTDAGADADVSVPGLGSITRRYGDAAGRRAFGGVAGNGCRTRRWRRS